MSEWSINKTRNSRIKELRNSGWSVRKIAKELQCSKAIVSYHCRGTPKLPNVQGGDGLANRNKWVERIETIKISAKEQWTDLKKYPWFVGFLGIYWGEGQKSTKQTKSVGVTNNDPHLIKIIYESIVKWTNRPIVATITYYPLHDRAICNQFWAALLPTASIKFRDNTDKRSKSYWCDRCQYGSCDLRVNDFELFWKIMTWIECWKHGDLV